MKSAMTTVKKIACVGAGYVGGSTMPIVAEHCPDITVTIVDVDEKRINEWNSMHLPIYEPGLEEIVKGQIGKNLFFTAKDLPQAIKEADLIFIAVNTGTKEYGYGAGSAYDLTSWEAVARSIAKYATEERFYVIVEKSTVPVRTAEQVRRILDASKAPGTSFEVVSNPEFLAEGSAVRNLEEPDRVLIGGLETEAGKRATEMVADVYAHWIDRRRIITTNLWSSELAKLAANAFLAQRLSTVNALSAVCEATGAKIDEVTRVVGTDSRIGPNFLKTSVGWGGSCFKKDLNGLIYLCENYHLKEVADYFRQVIAMNEYQKERFARRILKQMFGTVRRKRILILGYAFKKDTGDTRESPAIDVCRFLTNEGAELHIYDPKVRQEEIKELFPKAITETDPYEGAKAAHAMVVLTEWDEFKTYDYQKLFDSMYRPAFLFDGRNILDHEKLATIGFQVYAVGERGIDEEL
jgi:UDPglucose 6-dehydrogenase